MYERTVWIPTASISACVADCDGLLAQSVVAAKFLPIDELELSVRARHACKRNDIQTLGELAQKKEYEILHSWKNFGRSSLEELRRALNAHGLDFKQGRTA